MKIAVIGSSLSGLVAGRKLALAGHDVTLFEQKSELGDKLATRKTEQGFFDYGIPFIERSGGEEFDNFVEELEAKKILYKWADEFQHFDGTQLHESHPRSDRHSNEYYASKKGLNAITDLFKRWMEIPDPVRVGGLTHIGADRSRKRSWMVNLTDISVFECDAVVIATDAANAYGILQTTQDEIAARRISRHVDEIEYYSRYSLMLSIDSEPPVWQGIECEDSDLEWIGNDSSKSEKQKGTLLTIQSSGAFALRNEMADIESITGKMLETASAILDFQLLPENSSLYLWKYYEPVKTLDDYFMELEMDEAPLALVGDYFNETSVEGAYLSGYYLAEYWIDKFEIKGAEVEV